MVRAEIARRLKRRIGLAILLVSCIGNPSVAQQVNSITEPKSFPIAVSAEDAARWRQGDYDVWHLTGQVVFNQGNTTVEADEAIIWSEPAVPEKQIPAKLIVYAEGEKVTVSTRRNGRPHQVSGKTKDELILSQWLGRFYSDFGVQFKIPILGPSPAAPPPIFARGKKARKNEVTDQVESVQFQQPLQPLIQQPQFEQTQPDSPALPPTQIEFKPRSKNPLNIRTFPSPDGSENIFLYTGGVRVSVEGQPISQMQQGISNSSGENRDRLTIEADTVVAWTNPLRQLAGNSVDDSAKRWEVYLEGNVVFSTDDRVVYAERMYYDVRQKRGTILQAELYSPVQGYDGMLRLKADVLQQIDENNVRAYGSAVTSSRIGVPRYWLQSEVVDLTRSLNYRYDEFGRLIYDPQTGQPETVWNYEGSSRNNFVYMLGVPIFFWPSLNANNDQGSYFISGLALKNDGVFGFQSYTKYNAFQLFGWRKPPQNSSWDLNLDYMSERGIGFGTEADYDIPDPYGFRYQNKGRLEAWGIFDDGFDNLGRDRRQLTPEKDFRGRIFWQHRNRYTSGFEVSAEVGWISDRNFLEQYREREWDQEKDETTGIQVKKLFGEQSFNVTANVRVNDFFTQSERLPSFDYFLLGKSLFNDRLTWSTHSHVGYYNLEVADPPLDPVDAAKFDPLAWEFNREGIIAGTRHEISIPIQTGVVKATPYAMGESIFYGEQIDGSSLTRTYGQAGVRLSLPMHRIHPNVRNVLFNLNGLAHKVEWESDLYVAEASENMDQLPLYHQLDDDAQEHFRRRFFFDSFGGVPGGNVPTRFDERNFAFRSGMQSDVTAASPEIVDDLMAARIGVNQRWQTKRGPAGNQRIVDWITLDMHGTLFPKSNRDNFGELLGVFNYDFRWHVGDRLTVLSDAYADFFSQGLRTISLGARMTRPEVGNLYFGFRSLEGPISANVLNSQINTRLAEKWILTLGTSVDFGDSGNLGQRFAISRIGESAIIRTGINVDASRGTTGLNFLIIPRFMTGKSLRKIIGVEVPPLGSQGIE
ncbi:organic solvent tolerance protein OstA [Pirellulaceae bacterium]|jgi:lipopolysaccharide export system protein LptA|nr:organic solvent tolerance protein OstA [Pirellulaceae bacterium]